MMKQVADSLAGRATYLRVGPMTRAELHGLGHTGAWDVLFDLTFERWRARLEDSSFEAADWRDAVRVGGYPVPALQLQAGERDHWFAAYVSTYLERDLRDLSAVELLGDF